MLNQVLDKLPESSGVVILLSGGMDSTIAMLAAVKKYGADKVAAISFDYGQRQKYELNKAEDSTKLLGVKHMIVNLQDLGYLSKGFSTNCDSSMVMPTLEDAKKEERSSTYVPNRNMVLLSIAASYAETKGFDTIICGLQSHDGAWYHDTTQDWINDLNVLLSHNKKHPIKVIAPFSDLNETSGIELVKELHGNLDFLKNTLTCYSPIFEEHEYYEHDVVYSCGRCPACEERIQDFKRAGEKDPVPYIIDIKW